MADQSSSQRDNTTGNRVDPEDLFDQSRKPSHSVAREWARDDADVDTTHGIPSAPGNPKQHDETDPTGQSHSDTTFTTDGSLKHGGGHRPDQPSIKSGSEHPTAHPGKP